MNIGTEQTNTYHYMWIYNMHCNPNITQVEGWQPFGPNQYVGDSEHDGEGDYDGEVETLKFTQQAYKHTITHMQITHTTTHHTIAQTTHMHTITHAYILHAHITDIRKPPKWALITHNI